MSILNVEEESPAPNWRSRNNVDSRRIWTKNNHQNPNDEEESPELKWRSQTNIVFSHIFPHQSTIANVLGPLRIPSSRWYSDSNQCVAFRDPVNIDYIWLIWCDRNKSTLFIYLQSGPGYSSSSIFYIISWTSFGSWWLFFLYILCYFLIFNWVLVTLLYSSTFCVISWSSVGCWWLFSLF